MRVFNLLLLIFMFIPFPLPAQVGERYIEVTGTSEIEVVPDRIHYVIEIRESSKKSLMAYPNRKNIGRRFLLPG